jgi:predicted dehydrogenase
MKDLSPLDRHAITRRQFAAGAFAAALLSGRGRTNAQEVAAAKAPPDGKWRAAIIGHTGEGDYGHGLDLAFNDRSNVEVVAVADPDATGRGKAAERSGARRQYSDYRELLEKEKPQLVCLASRWTHERQAGALAALRLGAHLITEKPFTASLAEADEILALAERTGAKIAVAHQMRLAPSVQALQKAIAEGVIGDLLEINAWGKQDSRAGGEDMIVLGSHLFDLMRLFAGEAEWCTARVLQGSRDVTRADARRVKEKIGQVTGEEISAQFGFARGVSGNFTSRARLQQQVGHWGIEFVGSKTSARLLADVFPAIYRLQPGKWEGGGRTDQWQRLESDPGAKLTADERGFGPANRRVVDDWLNAIAGNREPVCSGRNAMKAIEMIMAVYHAALSSSRVALPLKDRQHPLGG